MCLLIAFTMASLIGFAQVTEPHPLPLVERKYCFSEQELRQIDKVFYLHDLYKMQSERLEKNNAVLKKDLDKYRKRNKNALYLNITTALVLIALFI
jgi:hypothetical protein